MGPGDVSAQLSENAARAVTAGRGVTVADGAYSGVLPVRTRHWLAEVRQWATTAECRDAARAARVGLKTVLAVAADEADHADYDTGRELRTAHASVAARIGLRPDAVHRARWFLTKHGWEKEIRRGGYLTRTERAAARARHGRKQLLGASVRALTTPRHLALQQARAQAAAGRQRARYERLKRAMGASICRFSSRQPRSGRERRSLQRSSVVQARKRARTRGSSTSKQASGAYPVEAHRLAAGLLAQLPTGLVHRIERHLGVLVAAVAPLAATGWTVHEVLHVIDTYDRQQGWAPIPVEQQMRPLGLLIQRITRACVPDKRPGRGRQGVLPTVPEPEYRTTGTPAAESAAYVAYRRTTRDRPRPAQQDRHQRLVAAARLSDHDLRRAQAACPTTPPQEELSREAFVALVEQLDPRHHPGRS